MRTSCILNFQIRCYCEYMFSFLLGQSELLGHIISVYLDQKKQNGCEILPSHKHVRISSCSIFLLTFRMLAF